MKKAVCLFLCVLLLCGMLSITASAVNLPDGGQLGNTGEPMASGYTKGGTSTAKTFLICSVYLDSAVAGYFGYSRMVCANHAIGGDAYMRVTVKTNTATLAEKEQGSSKETDTLFELDAYTSGTSVKPTMAVAGYAYESTVYGSWVCGTTAKTFGGPQ